MDEVLLAAKKREEKILEEAKENKRKLEDYEKDYSKHIAAWKKMAAWKTTKNVTVNVRYLSVVNNDPATAIQFAQIASKKKPGSINLYSGHGPSGKGQKADPNAVKAVQKAFDAAPWKEDKNYKKMGEPLFAFSSCHAGSYNETIPPKSQIEGASTNPNLLVNIASLGELTPVIESVDAIVKKKLNNDEKVVINLYFGEYQYRNEISNKSLLPILKNNDTSLRYANWK